MLRRLSSVALAALLCSVAVRAQAPAAPAGLSATTTPPSTAMPFAPSVKDTPAPLTADERKDLELISLKAQLTAAFKQISDLKSDVGTCQALLGPAQFEQNKQALANEQGAFIDKAEKARPGWTFDPKSGAFVPKKPADKPKQ